VVTVDTLKCCLWVTAGALCLLAFAVFMVLTSTAGLLLTLAILAGIVFGLFRLVLSGTEQGRKTNPGG